MTTVREFSRCGPCIPLGPLLRTTARFYVYEATVGYSAGQAIKGERRIAIRTEARYSAAHVEPCHSCEDHARTQYPDGYMD